MGLTLQYVMRFTSRRRTIVRTFVSHPALRSASAHMRLRAHVCTYIYLHVCRAAHNCGWLLYVLNAPCKVTVFQLTATPDGVIVPASATRFGFLKRRLRTRPRCDVCPTSVTNSPDTLCTREDFARYDLTYFLA